MEGIFDEHAMAIGHLTISFNALEQAVTGIIGVVLGDEEAGEIVAAPLPFAKNVDVMAALIRHRITDPKVLGLLQRYVVELREMNAERNAYIHAEWWPSFTGENQDLEEIYRRRRQIRKQVLQVSDDTPDPRKIRELASRMRTTSVGMVFFKGGVEEALRRSSSKVVRSRRRSPPL